MTSKNYVLKLEKLLTEILTSNQDIFSMRTVVSRIFARKKIRSGRSAIHFVSQKRDFGFTPIRYLSYSLPGSATIETKCMAS